MKRFFTLVSMKLSAKSFIILVLLYNQSLGEYLFEGDTCRLKNGKSAICTKLQECTSISKKLHLKQISFDSVDVCSYIGTTAIICCEDRMIFEETPTKVTTQAPGEDPGTSITARTTTTQPIIFTTTTEKGKINDPDIVTKEPGWIDSVFNDLKTSQKSNNRRRRFTYNLKQKLQ